MPKVCKSPVNSWKYGMDCSHRKLGESSIFATDFKYKQLGSKKFHKLTDERNQLCKRTKADKEDLYQDLKRQLKELDEDFDFA